jgi:hypothetical protein
MQRLFRQRNVKSRHISHCVAHPSNRSGAADYFDCSVAWKRHNRKTIYKTQSRLMVLCRIGSGKIKM